MRALWTVAAILVGMAASAICAADTAVLTDGARFTGEVTVTPDEVVIRSSSGQLTFPAWRVARVEKWTKEAAPPEPQSAAEARPAPAPALRQPVSVRFADVPLRDALEALCGSVGLKLDVSQQVRGLDASVNVTAEDQPAEAVLERMLQPNGLRHRLRPDGVLWIGRDVGRGRAEVRKALDSRIAVDFEGVSLAEVLRYIREVADMTIVAGPAARMETDPVRLRVSDASVRTILDVVLEPRGLDYGVRPDGILYVDARRAVEKLEFRLYPVTDLLLSTADTAPAGRAGARPDRGEEAGILAPQFAPAPVPARQRVTPTGAQDEMGRRTEGLVGILNYCCGRGRWVRFGPTPGAERGQEPVVTVP